MLSGRIRIWAFAAAAAAAPSGVFGLFERSKVKIVSPQQFKQLKAGGSPFIAKFFSPRCGHCVSFAPEYEKAAAALHDIVEVVGVEDQSLMQEENIRGFPTVKFYAGKTVAEFRDERTAKKLTEFLMAQLRSLVSQRLSGGSKSGGPIAGDAKDVVVLTDANFEAQVGKGGAEQVWLVELYAPWCGHCKSLEPVWNQVATELKGKVKVAKVDATANAMVAEHFGVRGFPTIVLFPPGGNRDWNNLPRLAVPYNEHRSKTDIIKFAQSYAGAAAKVSQLLSQDQFDAECSTGVCILTFVPNIYDSSATARQATLDIVNKVIPSTFALPVKFFWSEGGEQFALEEKLHLAFGFPAVIALNKEKGKYGVHRGAFTEEGLKNFVTGLMAGRVSVDELPANLPKLKTVAAWDGKDAPVEESEASTDEEMEGSADENAENSETDDTDEAEAKAEKEAKEKAEKEAKAKAEKEAKAKAEKEAKAKAEKEAKAKAEKEAKAKAEKEAKAKAEKEAKAKAEKEAKAKAEKEAKAKAEKEAKAKAEKEAKAKAEKEAKADSDSEDAEL